MTAFEIDDKEFARVLPNPKIDGLIRKPVLIFLSFEYEINLLIISLILI
jgi:hypothetical protein